MLSEEHAIDLLPAYALDCLEEDERRAISKHLESCAVCRAELLAYQTIAEQLPLAAPQVEPPPELKRRLMASVEARQAMASDRGREDGQISFLQRLVDLLRQSAPAWGLASLVLILLLVASNLLLWQQVNRLNNRVEVAEMRVVALTSTDAAPGATGLLVISVNGEHGTLVVDNLPKLSEDLQYQLWLIKDGARTNGGVFSVSKDGYGSLWVSSPQPLASYSGFGITIEPAGGSPGPTGDRVLGGSL